METEFCIVLVTANKKDSENIKENLIKEKLSACVNSCEVNSCFFWEGLKKEDETLLIIKTRVSLLEKVEIRVKELSSYDVPEIIAIPIIHGSHDYLKWLNEATKCEV